MSLGGRTSRVGYVIATGLNIPLSSDYVVASTVELKGRRVDSDSIVGIRDISAAAAFFGQSTGDRTDSSGRIVDINGHGDVDAMDISLIASNLGLGGPLIWPE